MHEFSLSRRALLATAGGLLASGAPALAAKKKRRDAAEADKPAAGTAGNRLAFPAPIDVVDGQPYDLVAGPATHAFLKDKPVAVVGYGGTYMGPVLRLRRGTEPTVRLVNRLDRPTNVHWHGLLVEGEYDGGTHPGIAPGATWDARLRVDQPAATLWYHAHLHGRTARDVHDGLAGVLIVEDPAGTVPNLPSTWGVDDLALVLQDRTFDADGRPVYEATAATLEHGFRGRTMIVNGLADAVARVPQRRVRLRLINAAGSRTFRLFFEDQRPFHLIAVDAGFVPEPLELAVLPLAPGERAEILVDFAAGPTVLMTTPDDHEHRSEAGTVVLPDVLDAPARVVAFEAVEDRAPKTPMPTRLCAAEPLPKSTVGVPRRRLELRVQPNAVPPATGHGAMDHGAMDHGTKGHAATDAAATATVHMTINGRAFAADRIDETVALGTTEIWEIVSPDMSHPFHLHGAHFRVLSEDGDRPKLWNGGHKDTVLVENSAELLVTFTRRADAKAPFVYHCHLLEHEDGGMMGTFTVL